MIDGDIYTDTLPESGELTSVKLTRMEDDELEGCTIYAAIYSEGRLTGIRLAEITEFKGTEMTLDIEPMNIVGSDELKVMVWDTEMRPTAEILCAKR